MSENPCLTLVLGGARSGKSVYAEAQVERHPAPWTYIATAQAFDAEMRERIAAHRERRGSGWVTVDAPQELARLREGTDVTGDALVFSGKGAKALHKVRIGQKANVENQVGVRRNTIAESEAHHRDHQGIAAWVLKAVDDELAEFMHVEFCGVDHHVREAPDGRHAAAFLVNAICDRTAVGQGMGTARFAEAADQRVVARLAEEQGDGMLAAQPAIHLRQIFDLFALTSVDQKRGALDFSASAFVQLAEGRNERDGKIVHAVEAKVLEGIEY